MGRPYIGRVIDLAPGHDDIVRIVAPNPGPMTLEGTNTYLVGADPVWIVDPGPAIGSHVDAVRAAAAERGGIGGVVLTHSHADHSAGVALLGSSLAFGAVGEGDEATPATTVLPGTRTGGAGQDSPAGEVRVGPFAVISTPGHAADHVCFARGDVAFCGDLVLGYGSSIVPPAEHDGSLADYMASLERLRELAPSLLAPGHGPWITEPAEKLAEYMAHRRERERRLVDALAAGVRAREELLDAAWADVPDPMRPAAALAMRAHLEKLEAEGRLPASFAPGDAA